MPSRESALNVVGPFCERGLVSPAERDAIARLFDKAFPFAEALRCADSIHVHVKVDTVDDLPRGEITRQGGEVEYEKEGFVKFRFPGGTNMIFSSIAVSQDQLIETTCSRRERPFVDHLGIDLRQETEVVRAAFDALPQAGKHQGWEHVAQGDDDHGVHCCHVEVKQKHWIYPRATCGAPEIPLEFAFGELKVNATSGGCDLRPMDPLMAASLDKPLPSCGALKRTWMRPGSHSPDQRRAAHTSRTTTPCIEANFCSRRLAKFYDEWAERHHVNLREAEN